MLNPMQDNSLKKLTITLTTAYICVCVSVVNLVKDKSGSVNNAFVNTWIYKPNKTGFVEVVGMKLCPCVKKSGTLRIKMSWCTLKSNTIFHILYNFD